MRQNSAISEQQRLKEWGQCLWLPADVLMCSWAQSAGGFCGWTGAGWPWCGPAAFSSLASLAATRYGLGARVNPGVCQALAPSPVLHTSRDNLGGALKYNMLAKQIICGNKWYKNKSLAKIWVSGKLNSTPVPKHPSVLLAYFSPWANYFNPISHVTAGLICTWSQMKTSQLQLPSFNFILGTKVHTHTIFSQTCTPQQEKKKQKE